MNTYLILSIVFGSIILILLPFVFKTMSFKNPISTNDFSNIKTNKKPKFGIMFHYFNADPKIPDEFFDKCYKELYKLDSKNPPLGEELYAFAFEKYTNVSIFTNRAWGTIILLPLLIAIIAIILKLNNC